MFHTSLYYFVEEVEETLGCVERDLRKNVKSLRGTSWARLKGDILVRILAKYLSQVLPPKLRFSEPNSYIEGFPYEYDLLIVKKHSEPMPNTPIYKAEDVMCGMEVKYHGIISPTKELENVAKRIKKKFKLVNNAYPHIKFIYITFKEVTETKRKASTNFLEVTRYALKPYPVFCLVDSRTSRPRPEDWNKLIEFIKHLK